MMKKVLALSLFAVPGMALAAEDKPHGLFDPSLGNTDFVVLIGFLLFLAIIFYFNVPAMLGGMLDKRAEGIKADLDEARALREEAQSLLASYERKSREVADQAERIVAQAKADAEAAAAQARADLPAAPPAARCRSLRARTPARRPRTGRTLGCSRTPRSALQAVFRVEKFERVSDVDPIMFERRLRRILVTFRPEGLRW